jgi:hypothetical protein
MFDPNSWSHQALRSVINVPLEVAHGSWVNGQHRAQAAIDAGAPRVLILTTTYPSAGRPGSSSPR